MSEYNCPQCSYEGSWMGVTVHHSKKHGEKLDKSEYLINDIKKTYQQLEKVPTRREYDEFGEFTSKSCEDCFGSWNNALRECGFAVHTSYDYTEDDLLEELQRLSDELGRSPYYHEMKELSKYSNKLYTDTYGTWNDALKAANLELNKHMGIVDKDHQTQRKLHEWQKSVKERDSYECQDCGSDNHIHAHHIKRKGKHPDKMFDVDNGVSLCVWCHADRHEGEYCYDMLKAKAKSLSRYSPSNST